MHWLRYACALLCATGASSLKSSRATLSWTFDTGCNSVTQPLAYNGNIYISSRDPTISNSHIDAIRPLDGTLVWSYGTSTASVEHPLVGGFGMIYSLCNDPSAVFALNATNDPGQPIWPVWSFLMAPYDTYSALTLGSGKIFTTGFVASTVFRTAPPRLFALDALKGPVRDMPVWTYDSPTFFLSEPLYAEGSVLVGITGLLVWLDADSGKVQYEIETPADWLLRPQQFLPYRNMSLWVGYTSKTPHHTVISVVDSTNRALAWSHDLQHTTSSFVRTAFDEDDEMFYVSLKNTHTRSLIMYKVDALSGEVAWNYTSQALCWSAPVCDRYGQVLFTAVVEENGGSMSEKLIMLNASTGIVRYAFRAATVDATACDSEVPAPLFWQAELLLSSNGKVYALFTPDDDAEDVDPSADWVADAALALAVPCSLIALWMLYRRFRIKGYSLSIVATTNESLSSDSSLPPFSKYEVVEKLGSGGFGVVFKVVLKQQTKYAKCAKPYALKYIACASESEREAALNEWRTISRLPSHPNMIEVQEILMNWSNCGGTAADLLQPERYVCIVMAYYPEGDLRSYISSVPPGELIAENTILSFAGQVCSLLSVMHCQSPPLIHRDLKPENILLKDDRETVVVSDFGLAKRLTGTHCQTHAGTYAFMAPEVWERKYSVESDMWAVGCILYAMCSKQVGSESRIMWRELSSPGFHESITAELSARGYSTVLSSLVVSLLSASPQQRLQAREVLHRLAHLVPSESLQYSEPPSSHPDNDFSTLRPSRAPCSYHEVNEFMS
ncbi:Serine/threonine-protein kinase Nek4 [Diplonema papillatum]|nr:Serine/threonine-protein kinase Nek4 [Diplonema papillatum]